MEVNVSSRKMRIAYLTSRLPFPPIDGGRIRSYHFLRHLLRFHEVTLYAIGSDPGRNADHFQRLDGLSQNLFQISTLGFVRNAVQGLLSHQPLQTGLYKSGELALALAQDFDRGNIDVIIAHLIRTAEYPRPFGSIPRILDMTDSIHLNYARMRGLSLSPHRLAAHIERERLEKYEPAVCSRFDNVLLASPLDIAWLQQRHCGANLTLIPTGIDTSDYPFHQGSFDRNRIIFVGKLDYLPNTDAVTYFVQEVLPLVRQAVPKAEFVAAGWNPPRSIQRLARKPYVKILPNVHDVRPEVSRSAISVAPMRFGAGIQVKVLESLALGTPAVATESVVGAFGEEGKNAIPVGRDPREFAEKVVSVLRDTDYRERLRHAGRKLIETRFQWDQVLAPLDGILRGFAKKGQEPNSAPALRGHPD